MVFASLNSESCVRREKCRLNVGWSASIVNITGKLNVLCFGKSQQGSTLACSRLTLEVRCIAFVKACS